MKKVIFFAFAAFVAVTACTILSLQQEWHHLRVACIIFLFFLRHLRRDLQLQQRSVPVQMISVL